MFCQQLQGALVPSLLERGQDPSVLADHLVGDQLFLAVEPHSPVGDDPERVARAPSKTPTFRPGGCRIELAACGYAI
jgi:hypothetical protein